MATDAPSTTWLEHQLEMVRGKLIEAQNALANARDLGREADQMEPHWSGDFDRFRGPITKQLAELVQGLEELSDADSPVLLRTRCRDLIDQVEELLELTVLGKQAPPRWLDRDDAR